MSNDPRQHWNEADSTHFIDLGRVYTPRRDEIGAVFCDLIPAEPQDAFTGVELGVGADWLMRTVLDRYPHSSMIGLDGSTTMLTATAETLIDCHHRIDLRQFRLEERAWIDALPDGLRVVVSSLVIHHLDGPSKRQLFADLHAKLASGGALLICDVVAPANHWGQRQMARGWDELVRSQPVQQFGDNRAFRRFDADQWNFYEYPDPDDLVDKPSSLIEQLGWLAGAGFTGIDVWWAGAGHALFGGYRGS